jgi:hypothetical protein
MAQAVSAHSTSAPAPSRDLAFLNRVDAHLPTLASDQARRAFLSSQLTAWQARYSKFLATAGSSESITKIACARSSVGSNHAGKHDRRTAREGPCRSLVPLRRDRVANPATDIGWRSRSSPTCSAAETARQHFRGLAF